MELLGFYMTDRIQGMHDDTKLSGELEEAHNMVNSVDTRMNNIYIVYDRALKNYGFITSIRSHPAWPAFWDSRSKKQKESYNSFFHRCNHTWYEKIDMVKKLTAVFHYVHKLVSRQDVPLSAFVLLVQAMYNEGAR